MLTAVSCSPKKHELIPILERLGMKDISSFDWDNRMLVIHMMHKALEIVKNTPDEMQYIIMMTLARCYEDRGLFHEAIYWCQKCLQDCGCCSRPLPRLHAQGNLLTSLIRLQSMPDAGQFLDGIPAEPPGIDKADALAYAEHLQALALYFEAKKQSLEDNVSLGAVKKTADLLLEICGRYDACLLLQKLRLGALEILACQSLRAGDLDGAIGLFKRTAAAAFSLGSKQKAADCRKAISAIYESMGKQQQAWRQYRKYYQLSARICRKKSEEFSDYLFAVNKLNETEREISSLREMKEYLSLKRNTDALTGVYNRRFWEEALEQKAAASGPEAVFSVFMLDIDSFKEYNDTHGHLEGDKALKAIGGLLKDCVRTKTDVIARFGGDEFVILIEGMGEKESKRVAERILARIRDYRFNGCDLSLTASIGIATGAIDRERRFESLLEEVDAALYDAKSRGKNRITHILDVKKGEDA